MTSTTSTKTLREVEQEEFIRNKISPERKLEILKTMQEPKKISPTAKALLENKEKDISAAAIPIISKEMIIDRKLIDSAPDEWNFFGKPDKESYDLLMNSILVEGLMNPITLWKQKSGRYMILSGHTRDSVFDDLYQASGDPRWLHIPAKYYDVDDITENDARRIIILANIAQRAKETPRVRIRCYGEYAKLTKARASYGSGIDVNEVVAETFGINRATVFFYRRLSNLIDPILDYFCDGKITRVAANILCGLSVDLQKYLLENGYLITFNKQQYQALRKARTTEDIDKISSALEEEIPQYKYSVKLKVKKPKDTMVFGICFPKKVEQDCHDLIREAIQKSDIDGESKRFILSQLD